jgi:hypothetical protein
VAANFRIRISMQPIRSCIMGLPFFLVGEGEGGSFFQVVFGVERGLSTVNFPCKLFFGGEGGFGGVGKGQSKEFLSS